MARLSSAKSALTSLTLLALGAGLLRYASRLPSRIDEPESRSPDARADIAEETEFQRTGAELRDRHPGLSGLHLLPDAHDAFATRMLLAERAERTLDLQYYIWHGDRTGTLLLEALHRAAQRGVKVRLLLDDNGISGLDTVLAALDRHPNISVRLFNPFRIRFPKAIGFIADFGRLNRRMHNKSFTADGVATIIGGRNVGDEYFGGRDGGVFADLDVLTVGAAVPDMQRDFERYWSCPSAYPARQILPQVSAGQMAKLTKRASLIERDPSARQFVARLSSLPIIRELGEGTLPLEWCPVQLVSDDPAKAAGHASEEGLLAGKLEKAIGSPQHELGVIAGYFVPGERGTAELCGLAERGVAVTVLTNAFAANDVAMVHAGYAPSRKALLEAGVVLYEMFGDPVSSTKTDRRQGNKLGIGSRLRGTGTGSAAALRSHASTLHAKTFTVDRERLFIGSFNFDPRSRDLNTELGFVIESPLLAGRVADAFRDTFPAHAYRVDINSSGQLAWTEQTDSGQVAYSREPNMRPIDHALVEVGQRLPIQWLL